MVDSDLERYYAVYVKLKSIHSNGRFYNSSLYSLSKQSKLSRNSIRKYADFFTKEGWIIKEHNTISFISSDKFNELYGIKLRNTIKLSKNKSVTEITNTLRYELLKEKQNQFNYLKEVEKDKRIPTNLKSYKRALRLSKDYKCENISTNLKISVKKIGIIINKSSSTATRLIKTMKSKIIQGERKIFRYSANVELPNGFFFYKGCIMQKQCNQYIF